MNLLDEVKRAVPDNCDGKEQEAFEAWATSHRYDMGQHPLHYLFLDSKTYAARDGWNAAITYCRSSALAALEAAGSEEMVEKVARALARKARISEMEANGFNGIHVNEYVEMCWVDHKDRARAALAAMGVK